MPRDSRRSGGALEHGRRPVTRRSRRLASIVALSATIAVGGAAIIIATAPGGRPAGASGGDLPAGVSSITVPSATPGHGGGEPAGERAAGAHLAPLAKITAPRAQAAALAAVPGAVVATAIEDENGNLVWSVEIRAGGGAVHDVLVDAGNGRVLRGGYDD